MQPVPAAKNIRLSIVAALVWAAVQAVLLFTNHVGTINEAPQYIHQAHYFLDHHTLENPKYIFYFLPVFTIAIGLKTHLGLGFTIFVQLLVNAVATIAFYKTACHLFGRSVKSCAATLIYITFIPLQQWNSFIYTESLFYSCCVFFVYACTVLPVKTTAANTIRLAVLVLLVFTRPLGLLFIPVLCFYYVVSAGIARHVKWLIAAGAVLLPYLLFNFLYKSGAGLDILLPQQQGMIICTDELIAVKNNLTIPATGNPINNLALFIWYNPLYFSKLALARLLSFFNLCRSGYSILHNAYFIAVMAFLYGGTAISFIRLKKGSYQALINTFLPLLILLVAGVMLQCNEYNNRFSLTLFPWFILFAADGLFALPKNKCTGFGKVQQAPNK